MEDKRNYLYNEEYQSVLESKDIETVGNNDFKSIIKGFFGSESWMLEGESRSIKTFNERGLDVLKNIIKAIKT